MRLFKKTATAALCVGLMVGIPATATATATDNKPTLTQEQAKAQQAYALGVQTYIWGYPMVVMQRAAKR